MLFFKYNISGNVLVCLPPKAVAFLCGVSMFSAWVLSAFSSFFPQSKDMHGSGKLATGECDCVFALAQQ